MEFVFEEPKREGRRGIGRQTSHTRSFYTDKLNNETRSPVENSGMRSMPSNFGQMEITETPKKRKRAPQKVKYLNDVKKKKRRKAKSNSFKFTWAKFSWFLILCLTMRLFFMESGVIDYYSTQSHIQAKIHEMELLKIENQELVREIHEIKVSPIYQKKLAREHLGVIAKDEYLVLFASDN